MGFPHVEHAHSIGQDPFEFRRSKLQSVPRFKNVLEKVAEMSNWGKVGRETFQGMALHKSFGSIVGQVAQISRLGEKFFQ